MNQDIPKSARIIRNILIGTATFSVGGRIVQSTINGPTPIHTLRFFTLQTNLMILIWTILAVLWRNTENYGKLTGFVKGALTTYISITWIVFMFLIEPLYDPVGIEWFMSLFNHYVNPFLFIADFILAEKSQLQWRWPTYWLAYPLSYLAFALIWGQLFNEYLYFFLDVTEIGIFGLIIWTTIMTTGFYLFGLLYTFINRNYMRKDDH